ncbi:hypothetical protein IMZ48_02430, partial [Candidatus Bathyarchaeota archaeon]|nr:hypothetical protein [Candidatus Bathyarchaeota archaeon]
ALESGPQTVNVGGQDRQFIVRVPEGYDNANPYRLVLGMHWWGGTMDDVAYGLTVEEGAWNYYGLERLAEETTIFVAPNGIDGNWYNEGGSDYAFIDEVNRVVEESLCIDTDLRFTIGFSWGGSMSVALACRGGDFPVRATTAIAAAGPFECKLIIRNPIQYQSPCTNTWTGTPGTEALGYLGIHGIDDNPDNGRSMRDVFIANNECTGEETPQVLPGSPHVRTDYQCTGPPVSWVTFVSFPNFK